MQYIRYVKYQHFELCHFFYQYQQKWYSIGNI